MNDNVKFTSILIFVAFCWGAAYPVMKIAISGVDSSPAFIMGARFLLSSVLLLLVFYRHFRRNFRKTMLRPVTIVSLALFLDFFFYSEGLKFTTATNSGFITGISVVFVPFILFALDRVRVKKEDLLSVLIIVIGIFFLGSNSGAVSLNRGDLLSLMSPVMFALYVVLLSRYSPGIDPICFTVIQMAVVGILGLAFSFVGGGIPDFTVYSTPAWICLVLLTVFGTALPFLLQIYAQPHTSALAAAIIYSLMPLFSLVTSVWLLGESLLWRGYLGGFLMVGAVILAKVIPVIKPGSRLRETEGKPQPPEGESEKAV